MKLNATSEMIRSVGRVRTDAARSRRARSSPALELTTNSGAWLAQATGYGGVSLQPNAGRRASMPAAGDQGLARIAWRRPARHLPDPESAHGTNPASAQMAGLQVVVTKCDRMGRRPRRPARQVREHHDRLACVMITYPSTLWRLRGAG